MELTVEYIKKRIGNKYTSEDIDAFELKRKEWYLLLSLVTVFFVR